MLAVTRVIIDSIYQHTAHQTALPGSFWWLVGLEFVLAGMAATLGRLVTFCDQTLAEKFTRHISIRLMTHASKLDLTTYEDPSFYDKLERARVQSIDRVQMIELAGRLLQEIAEFSANSGAPRTRLPAYSGRQQRRREGTETVWAGAVPDRPVQRYLRRTLRTDARSLKAPAAGRLAAWVGRVGGLLQPVRVRDV
jgi:hypothetical protein